MAPLWAQWMQSVAISGNSTEDSERQKQAETIAVVCKRLPSGVMVGALSVLAVLIGSSLDPGHPAPRERLGSLGVVVGSSVRGLSCGWMCAPSGVVVVAVVGDLAEAASVGIDGVDVPAGHG